MAKALVAVAVGIVVLGGIAQLVIPGFVERGIESSLTDDPDVGGQATVDARAFPAVRLLWGSGDRLDVRGRGLKIDLADRIDDPLGRLDGFDEVDIDLEDLVAGPVEVQAFSLVKNDSDTSFYLRMEAMTTPLALAEAVGGEIAGDFGRMIAGAATSALPDGGESELPIDIEGQVNRGDGGRVDVDGVRASVAGIPAGPFAETMLQAVIERI